MIDTDKYEGHTGPWLLIDGDIYKGGPKGTHKSDNMIADTAFGGYETTKARYADRLLMADAPLLLEELKRAYQLILDAAWQLHWSVGTTASSSHLSSKEWDEDIYAPAQAWRKQVQDILDASEEGCPWKESEGE